VITPETFRALRSLSGLTQLALAYKAGVSPTSIAEFELGRRDIRLGTLEKLFCVMGVSATFRMGDTIIGERSPISNMGFVLVH